MIRRFLGYMPQNVWDLPPVVPAGDPVDRCEDELLSIVPEERRRAYNMRQAMQLIFDRGSIFELQPKFGRALITSLARLDGYPVGVLANNPTVYGGALNVAEPLKQRDRKSKRLNSSP